MKKKVLIITSLVMALALSFVVFSYTMDELKSVFLTRDEFDIWANSSCGLPDATNSSSQPIGMSEYLENVEQKKIMSINLEAGYQMYRREIISASNLSEISASSPDVYESWSKRRSKELENLPSITVPPVPPAYTNINWTSVGATGANWMSKILAVDPNRYLHEINLPGTHDSGAQYVKCDNATADSLANSYAVCQNKSISEQLNMGVRFFDIRLDDATGPIVCHGDTVSVPVIGDVDACFKAYKSSSKAAGNELKFKDVLDTMKTFLTTNTGETIVLCIKNETGDETTCKNNVNTILGDAAYSSIIYSGSSFPKLNDVKGKIVIASRLSGVSGLGFTGIADNTFSSKSVDSVNIAIEDHYDCSSADKKGHVKNALGLSGSVRTLSNINTDGTTKGTTGGLIFTSTYTLLSETPQVAAGVVNTDFKSYAFTQGKNYGWIVFNFVDADLCKKVWETNP